MIKISVIIPTFNRYKELQRALKSVYNQTYTPFEVIVVDDGSTDATSEISTLFPQVYYIYQENQGVSSARNFGVKQATGDWIAFLDSDDEWEETKLHKQVDFHQKHNDILVSYTDEKWIRLGEEVNLPKKFQKYGGEIFQQCLSYCIIAPSSVLIQKDFFERMGSFDENLVVCEDYDLWLRIAKDYNIGLIEEKLIFKYGGASDQLSTQYWGMDRFRVQSLEKLLQEVSGVKKLMVVKMLLKKYKILFKGAIKYKREKVASEYEQRIQFLQGYLK